MKYRSKPKVIEAMQVKDNEDQFFKIKRWLGECFDHVVTGNGDDNRRILISIGVKTLDRVGYAEVGDYIIKGIKGEFYPCKPDIFLESYEAVKQEKELTLTRRCPVCKSDDILTERRMNGDSTCAKCGYKNNTKYFDSYEAVE